MNLQHLSAFSQLPEVVRAFEQADSLTAQIVQHGGLVVANDEGIHSNLVTRRYSVGSVPVAEDYEKHITHPLDVEIAVGAKGDVRQVIGGGLVSNQEISRIQELRQALREGSNVDARYLYEGNLKEDIFFPMQAESLLKIKKLFQGDYDLDDATLERNLRAEFDEEVGKDASSSVTFQERISNEPKLTHLAASTFGKDDETILSLLSDKGIEHDPTIKRLRGLIITMREHAMHTTVGNLQEWQNQVRRTSELDGVEVLRVGDLYDRIVSATDGNDMDSKLQSWRGFKGGGKPRPSTLWYPLQLLKKMWKQDQ